MASIVTDLLKVTGENIRARRKELHLSQTELALETGLDKASVSRIESGKQELTVTMLGWLAKALAIEPDFLLRDRSSESNAEVLISFIEENRVRINALPRESAEKAKRHMALSMDLEDRISSG